MNHANNSSTHALTPALIMSFVLLHESWRKFRFIGDARNTVVMKRTHMKLNFVWCNVEERFLYVFVLDLITFHKKGTK